MLVFISLICGAIASISSKFAAMRTNPLAFMAVSYLLSSLFSFGFRNKLAPATAQANFKEALIIGIIIGIINFAGYYTFLKALALGPLSIVISIISLHFTIAILLAVLIYKEELTPSRIVGIGLTILSIVLLHY
jgi:drug/metabolite transporter (DMT)-like permease